MYTLYTAGYTGTTPTALFATAERLGRIAEAVECAAKACDLPGVRRLHDRISLEVQRVADQVRIQR